MYPPVVNVTIVSSSGTRSISVISPNFPFITLVLRLSPNFSLRAANSLTIIPFNFSGLFKIASNSLILSRMAFNSSSIFSLSNPANVCNRISKMATACRSVSLNFFIKFSLASSLSLDFLIVCMTASILCSAIINPSKIWARSLHFSNSNLVRRVITSCRCFMKYFNTSEIDKISGWMPSTSANKFKWKVFCKFVYW